jgi:hypothetical protein
VCIVLIDTLMSIIEHVQATVRTAKVTFIIVIIIIIIIITVVICARFQVQFLHVDQTGDS